MKKFIFPLMGLFAIVFLTGCNFDIPAEISTSEREYVTVNSEDSASAEEEYESAYKILNNNETSFTEEELEKGKISFEEYYDLDSLGRCTGAFASVGTDLMPDDDREDISEVYPTGWEQTNYGSIDNGGWLYNRCHLIAYCLTGENDNEKNLITGTRYLNIEGMWQMEESVKFYLEENPNNHVLYRVTPDFDGNNLLASGVEIEAKSVEDDGLEFHVYCYNIQPNITIDYATGESEETK
ncbi:DNA/RNA non-specific endonuclease [Eubacterium oxidoreducens]|uniref:DNA-entry nuclease n=1 Tax=Eubacterium oxidoreducens TaxID=1732 RepID=A0A1G6B331_EUBOX|nr:DNA/RNA non-specific endonuclease [Eubacterium oxidoreducens]SDB15091.1 DNA-entry nuclease [Eubacterium oxidoreducens]